MADPKYFVTPFGESGDLTTVPDDSQTDGSVNYTDGFGPDYALDPDTDSSARDIARGNVNDLFYQITLAIQKAQQWYAPDFITASANGDADYAYPAGARVLYGGVVYKSLTDNNTGTPGVSANWIVVDSDLATAAALSNAITTINEALALKAPLASPGLTGTPTTPTAASGTDSTQIASTAFVTAAISTFAGTLAALYGFTYSFVWPGTSGSTGWFKHTASKFMIQWGTVSVEDNGTSTLTLSQAYANSNFHVLPNIRYSSNPFSGETQSCWANPTSASSVAVSFQNTADGSQSARTIGVVCIGQAAS